MSNDAYTCLALGHHSLTKGDYIYTSRETYNRELCMSNETYTGRRPETKNMSEQTYKRDLWKKLTKETYKRDIWKKLTEQTYKRDLQKRPTQETHDRNHEHGTYMARSVFELRRRDTTNTSKGKCKGDLQQKPIKETYEIWFYKIYIYMHCTQRIGPRRQSARYLLPNCSYFRQICIQDLEYMDIKPKGFSCSNKMRLLGSLGSQFWILNFDEFAAVYIYIYIYIYIEFWWSDFWWSSWIAYVCLCVFVSIWLCLCNCTGVFACVCVRQCVRVSVWESMSLCAWERKISFICTYKHLIHLHERWGAGVETQKKCTGRGWGMGSSTI